MSNNLPSDARTVLVLARKLIGFEAQRFQVDRGLASYAHNALKQAVETDDRIQAPAALQALERLAAPPQLGAGATLQQLGRTAMDELTAALRTLRSAAEALVDSAPQRPRMGAAG